VRDAPTVDEISRGCREGSGWRQRIAAEDGKPMLVGIPPWTSWKLSKNDRRDAKKDARRG
jgi:hypothetical protein